ncbi:MAG: glycoside hydrolase family 3 C-terminal domain-containing protein [Myxococcales bacterium]
MPEGGEGGRGHPRAAHGGTPSVREEGGPAGDHQTTVQEAFDLAALNRGNLGLRLADVTLGARVEALLARFSLDQKLAQMHGESSDPWEQVFTTRDEPALGVLGFRMVDGPRGVRAGLATTFPVALARGATWNPELEARVGQAIAREARARGANVLLAPAINLLRHPGWGRAQETYGEDSLHVGRMGAAFIAGAQRELIASVKHLALNSIEDTRFQVDVRVGERSLREVYLPHFEYCVREAHVGSVMSAYNKVNGAYCAENMRLLHDLLKDEWGFRGFVESDWVFGTRSTEPSLRAGLDVEMPSAKHYGEALGKALRAGRVTQRAIDEAVRRILRVKLAFGLVEGESAAPPAPDVSVIECAAHQDLALEVAQQSLVLLKNEGDVLPLATEGAGAVAVVGQLAGEENTGDHGSSSVSSSFVIGALEGIADRLGAGRVKAMPRDVLDDGDRAALRACRAAVVVVGLNWRDEGELIPFIQGGGDRDTLMLSERHRELVREVAQLVPRTVVVLQAGSAVEVRDFVDRVPALLMAWYPGMLGGEALADVLFGVRSPSGKLPVSIPRSAHDLVPFDHRSLRVHYGFDHGYRHLDLHGCEAEFPFGFGLSYTRFRYDDIALSMPTLERLAEDEELCVSVTVTNVGARAGTEVVQLYLSCEASAHYRSPKVLVGFGRLSLEPGETRQLHMRLGTRELRYYDVVRERFEVERTTYLLRAGPDSQRLPLSARFSVT